MTVFLAALALGYRAGGRFDGPAREKVARNLAGAAAWSAVWLSRFGVAFAFEATAFLPPLGQVAAYTRSLRWRRPRTCWRRRWSCW